MNITLWLIAYSTVLLKVLSSCFQMIQAWFALLTATSVMLNAIKKKYQLVSGISSITIVKQYYRNSINTNTSSYQ